MERELELFDTRLDQVPDTVESTDSGEAMVLETDEEVATIPVPQMTIATKNDTRPAKTPVQPTVSRDIRSNQISPEQREETVKEILVILSPLNAQSPPPDLLPRAAKHLEHKTFQKVSNERSVNALGRSSTLLTAGKPSNLAAKYTKAKEKILQKVKQYVQTATSEDVDLENIQQGEIWEVFREVLDDKDL
jgi:hypothetical protein